MVDRVVRMAMLTGLLACGHAGAEVPMYACLIAGDSIGVGMSQAAPFCKGIAETGIDSKRWIERYANQLAPARTVMISLGTNDTEKVRTYANLHDLRARITAYTVVWVLPSPRLRPLASRDVASVAAAYNDLVLEIPPYYLGADGIHLSRTGYQNLSSWMKPK